MFPIKKKKKKKKKSGGKFRKVEINEDVVNILFRDKITEKGRADPSPTPPAPRPAACSSPRGDVPRNKKS